MSVKTLRLLSNICRLSLAALFIFSGFVKVVDPWGTAIKVNEYLSIYGCEFLRPAAMMFSIWLCGAELMMGCMLLFKVRIRLVSIFTFGSLLFFTILTFLSATWLPVEDCGCFGEAVKLSPWQTFAKNAVMLPMSIIVWWRYRRDKIFAFKRMEVVLTLLFFSLAMGIGIYCVRHLPLIDFLPYKIGVNLLEAKSAPAVIDEETETILIYRNKRSGKIREFKIDDTEWQDSQKWEWVDTQTISEESDVKPLISEFALHNANDGDVTEQLLAVQGRVYMICVTRFDAISPDCEARLHDVVEKAYADGDRVICITPQSLVGNLNHSFADSESVPCYNIDASTLKTMLRATTGLVVLDDGVIVGKQNCIDIKM